jgi:hypothetical protein
MSYNGSGTFTINSTGQPVVAGTVITASAFNALTTDLATGLTTAITKDGQTTTTARITFAQGITSSLTTDSSSVSTGSIITGGGVGIAKALYVGTTANVAGAVTLGGIATFSAQPIFSSLTASSAVATDASKGLVSVTNTGTGNNVLATSPTITTPTISSLSSASATALTLQSAGTTAVTIDTSQNVGIGTTSPANKLEVTGDIKINAAANGTRNLYLGPAGGNYAKITYDDSAGTMTLGTIYGYPTIFNTNNTERMRIDSSGNVGIGTTTPPTRLGVQLSSATTYTTSTRTNNGIQIYNSSGTTNGYTGIEFVGEPTSGNGGIAGIGSVVTGSGSAILVFGTRDSATYSEKMRILSGGSVCVNTTQAQVDATSRLIVATTTASGIAAEFTNNTSGTCAVAINNSGAATSTLVNWYAANNYRAAITWNGTLVVYGTSSDARLKENITDAGSGLAKLADVKIRSFDWKESGAHTDFGVVAQELQAVAPEAVLVGKDNEDGSIKESWSVDSSVLVPAMIKAIQELKAINDSLTARIVALESK